MSKRRATNFSPLLNKTMHLSLRGKILPKKTEHPRGRMRSLEKGEEKGGGGGGGGGVIIEEGSVCNFNRLSAGDKLMEIMSV